MPLTFWILSTTICIAPVMSGPMPVDVISGSSYCPLPVKVVTDPESGCAMSPLFEAAGTALYEVQVLMIYVRERRLQLDIDSLS